MKTKRRKHEAIDTVEFFLSTTNLHKFDIPGIFFYKIDIKGFQNQVKMKLSLVGIELTTPAIYGLEGRCLLHYAT